MCVWGSKGEVYVLFGTKRGEAWRSQFQNGRARTVACDHQDTLVEHGHVVLEILKLIMVGGPGRKGIDFNSLFTY